MPTVGSSPPLTFLFTDIADSSELWERHRADFLPAIAAHHRLLRGAAERWNGIEEQTEGDSFFLTFARPSDAVRFAVDAQDALAAEDWPTYDARLAAVRVRIGMYTGESYLGERPGGRPEYLGPTVNRAARIEAAAHGGQILVGNTTRELALGSIHPEITFFDCGVHRLKGVGEERIWQICAPGLPRDFPPPRSLNPGRHNLPHPATPFIGRQIEVENWSRLLLNPETRLFTVFGPGGMGKTRTALQLAERCFDSFDDGVWWVGLEETRHVEGMRERIAESLRIRLDAAIPVPDQVTAFLRDRNLLLVLDNIEQIAGADEVVSGILRDGPGVTCLVTSRRSLDLQAEQLLELPPLPARDSESLFYERAGARRSNPAWSSDDAAVVTELCRRLEGVPLAIELAGSRMIGMSPSEILGRLDERFRLLQTRSVDLPLRQRTLRAVIDWSYGLLAEEDRTLLAQVAVFVGGFTLAAVEAVCGVGDPLEGIMDLRRHSFLQTEKADSLGRTRYRMLDSVRQYGLECLDRLGERVTLSARHSDYFVRFAEERNARLDSLNEAQALRELGGEIDNLRAALETRRGIGGEDGCSRAALALFPLLYRQGFRPEARRVLEAGLESLAGEERGALDRRADLLYGLASLALDCGDLADAGGKAEDSRAAAGEAGDLPRIADALNLLGLIAIESGEMERARERLNASLRLRADADVRGRARTLHNLALLASRRQRVLDAWTLYAEALDLHRKSGDVRGEARVLNNLGALAQENGDRAAARQFYLESLAPYRALGDPFGVGLALNNLGEIAEWEGDDARALLLYFHSERLFRQLHAAFASAPHASLKRLAMRLGEDRFALLQRDAEAIGWEEVAAGER